LARQHSANGNLYSVAGVAQCQQLVKLHDNLTDFKHTPVKPDVGDISANRTPTALPAGMFGTCYGSLKWIYIRVGDVWLPAGSPFTCNTFKATNYTTYYNTINADGTLTGTME